MERHGSVAQLLASLAKTLLDRDQPIAAWLREQAGEAANVERVSTDGACLQLDGVKLPISRRAAPLVSRRATVFITPATR